MCVFFRLDKDYGNCYLEVLIRCIWLLSEENGRMVKRIPSWK